MLGQQTTAPPPQHRQQQQKPHNVWEISETRGFASDEAFQDNISPLTNIKTESRENSAPMSIDTVMPNQPPAEIDYDELGLDFVLT